MHNVTKFPAQPNQDRQLRSVNEKIAGLAAASPYSEIQIAFSRVAQLAMEALSTAIELNKIPGIDHQEMADVVDFWYSLTEHARCAALSCIGGSQSLAEATVVFLFLQTSCDRKPAAAEPIRSTVAGKAADDVG